MLGMETTLGSSGDWHIVETHLPANSRDIAERPQIAPSQVLPGVETKISVGRTSGTGGRAGCARVCGNRLPAVELRQKARTLASARAVGSVQTQARSGSAKMRAWA